MRAVHVVPSVSEEASGTSYAVLALVRALAGEGCNVTLAALDWAPIPHRPPFLKAFAVGVGPRRLGPSAHMRRWLRREACLNRVDLIHNHGLWMMPNLYASWAAAAGSVPLVVSPHGTLSPWAFRSGSSAKRVFWPLLQRRALDRTACFHATAESEYEDIRRLGFRQPVAVIPNGVDVPELRPKSFSGVRTALFLGRLHPKKGLNLLLAAWARVQVRFSGWRLVIAGRDERGHRAEMEMLAREMGIQRAEFVGPLYGEEKQRAYASADVFVLPTYSENFGISVAEALAAGTPAIVTKGAPWAGLETHGAGWWVDIGVEPLAAALESAMSRDGEQLEQMGVRGRAWMERDFSWATIGRQMAETYRWLLGRGDMPTWVDL